MSDPVDPVVQGATKEDGPSSTALWSTVPSPSAPSDGAAATEVDLWTPRGIGWASVLLGFPGAIVLAALNWRRMGRGGKAFAHLAAAIVGTLALVAWAAAQPRVGSVGIVIGGAVAYYLFRVQRSDQTSFESTHRVASRGGLSGAVIALVGTIVIFGSCALIVTAATDGGVEHRGEVLFSTKAATDICSPTLQTTVFGPTDPIFTDAILRESVQAGAHVVYQLDGPGGTSGPYPVTAQPPFDCLGGTTSIGPLDPGTYVYRYRYADRPETPDLATGTFTVR